MKYLILFLLFLNYQTSDLYSQPNTFPWQVIEYEELKDFSLNGKITLFEIINLEEDWNKLRYKLGEPSEEIKEEQPADLGLRPTKIFHYPDLKIRYSDDHTDGERVIAFARVSIKGPDSFLEYKDNKIMVNHSIDILEELFPEAYSKARKIPLGDSGEYQIQLNVGRSNVGISFRYHPDDNKIINIGFYQIYT